MEKTNISSLKNKLYDVYPSYNEHVYGIGFIDFNESEIKNMPSGVIEDEDDENIQANPDKIYQGVIGPKRWKKIGDMKSLIIKPLPSNLNTDDEIKNRLKNTMMMSRLESKIQEDFIKKVSEISELDRSSKDVPPPEKFDILLDEFKNKGVIEGQTESHSIARRILSNFIKCGSLIATHGRIGPGNYLLMNNRTYHYLDSEYLHNITDYYKSDDFSNYYDKRKFAEPSPEDKTVKAKLSSFDIILDKNIEDDIIIEGRKNGDIKIGICVVVWTDKDGNILYNEKDDGSLELKYNVVDVGFFPERQYYSIHVNRIFSL